MIDVSIIIINYNTTALCRKCIQAVKHWTLNNSYEIILIDNASPDRSIWELQNEFPDVKFIYNEVNVGFGRANNIGINIALGKYLFLLNSDAFLLSDAISEFFNFMENPQNSKVSCCGADLFDADMKPTVSYGNFPSALEAFSSIGFFIFYKQYYKKHIHSGVINYSNHARPVDFLCGADMFIRKSVIDSVGKFDPDFFLYFEETELSYRMHQHGFQSYLLPYVKILHIEGASQATEKKVNFNKVYIFAKSRNIYFRKCYSNATALFVKLLYTTKALIMGIVKFDKDYFKIARLTFNS